MLLPLAITAALHQVSPRGEPEVRAVPYEGPQPAPAAEPAQLPAPPNPATKATTEAAPHDKIRVGAPGEGVRWTSADDQFSLRLGLRGQVRYTLTETPEAVPQHLLALRRARITFSGHTFGEHNEYKLELGLSPRDMGMTPGGPRFTPILDWALEFTQLRDLRFRVGQYKLPYSRTRMQSSGDLQFVDRSIADGEFNLNRDIGFDINSQDLFGVGHLRYYAGMFLGEGRDAYQATNFEIVYLGRLEVLPLGIYDGDELESDLAREKGPRLSLGAGYAFIDGARFERGTIGVRPEDGGTTDVHNATVDASFKVRGFTALAEGFSRRGRRKAGPWVPSDGLMPARDGYGWSAQAGYLLRRRPVEFAGRYGELHPQGRSPMPRRRQPTAVVGYYFFAHAVKLQLDYSPSWSPSGPPAHVVRLQFQAEL